MDSLTHIALGACVGEAFFDKKIGKKALLWGALANSLPDIDFVSGLWMNTTEGLLAHRGFTHSLLFMVLIVPALAMLAQRLHRTMHVSFKSWMLFFGIEIFLHLFIDVYNNYGVGLLEPFSHQRFSFNAIYVADPFFSIIPGIACVVLLFAHIQHKRRKQWWLAGIIIPFLYLGYCSINKLKIDSDVQEIFKQQGIAHERYFTTPAPLNNWLWFVVAGSDSGYHVGFRSLFDSKRKIDFEYFPRNKYLLDSMLQHTEVQQLIRFSQEYYTIEKWNDTLVLNDLRFGQMLGWKNPRGHFVFHYYLQHPDDNKLVVQRGRFKGWNTDVAKGLVIRIIGN